MNWDNGLEPWLCVRLVGWVMARAYLRTVLRETPNWRAISRRARPWILACCTAFQSANCRGVNSRRVGMGGSALYRPIGLDIFTHIITRSTNKMPLDEAVELAARLPRELHVAPYNGLLWNQSNQTIISRNKVLVREILCYMIGANGPSYTEQVLLQRYRRETGDVKVELPSQLV